MNQDWDISSFFSHEEISNKIYCCDVEGCGKAYSNRQNRRRHKLKDHPETMISKSSTKIAFGNEDLLKQQAAIAMQREQELLIETFSSFCDKFGEEQASIAMKNNKKLQEHLIPLRKIMEADIADRLSNAKDSQAIVEKQLTDFRSAIPPTGTLADELEAFKAVIKLVKEATPDTIGHLKQFCKVITALTNHMADYSEAANLRFKQARALKKVLDELFLEWQESSDFLSNTTPDRDKRKATEMDAPRAVIDDTADDGVEGSAKKSKSGCCGRSVNTF